MHCYSVYMLPHIVYRISTTRRSQFRDTSADLPLTVNAHKQISNLKGKKIVKAENHGDTLNLQSGGKQPCLQWVLTVKACWLVGDDVGFHRSTVSRKSHGSIVLKVSVKVT